LGSIFSIASAEIKSASSFGLLFQILPGKSFVMAHIFLVLVNPFFQYTKSFGFSSLPNNDRWRDWSEIKD
jgi:hypothetical protein